MDDKRLNLWLAFVVAIIASIAPTILSLAAYNQSVETHKTVNSRMTEMIKLVAKSSTDAATLAEKEAQNKREGDAAIEEQKLKDNK